ncbi:hypothetical protein B0H14DRAFT_2563988 [Mycena olivaceomarginata]|nr:hypothetical protein B0H14DRAFT_2563988 [Mycena olivaceomarginata]
MTWIKKVNEISRATSKSSLGEDVRNKTEVAECRWLKAKLVRNSELSGAGLLVVGGWYMMRGLEVVVWQPATSVWVLGASQSWPVRLHLWLSPGKLRPLFGFWGPEVVACSKVAQKWVLP